ncbi:MAG: glycosyltransferase family 39 protein [Anaerolineae bacterium]|nr:glycosyltransferase family 39 protein [Anaerolineae bacterium]
MTLLAALVRLRALQLVPTLTDETDDMLFALRIVAGGFWPAVSHDTYNGPLNHYLMALGLWAGVGPSWPRLLSLVLGALTVGLTYLLGVSLASQGQRTKDEGRKTEDDGGRKNEDQGESAGAGGFPPAGFRFLDLAPRLAGLVAASFMAVSFVPVVVNSHIAWSNATTPFWTTLALLALSEAVRRDRPPLLVLAGGLAGLAAQTHPTASLYLLGGAVWFVVTRPAWLRRRWTWFALLAALLAVSNLIGYNLVTGGGAAEQIASRDYAYTGGMTLADYRANVAGFLGLAYQLVGSTFVSTLSAQAGPPAMRSPLVIAYALVALVGLGYAAWRRASLPLIVWLTALVLLPVATRAYDSHISARYMAPLLPLTFAAVGTWLGAGLAGLVASMRPWRDRWLGLAALALTVALVVYPLRRLDEFYFYELRDGRNNGRVWQIAALLAEPGRQGAPILLDRGLRDARLDAGGHVYKALGTLLDLTHVPHDNPRVEELPNAPVGAWLVLTDARRDALASTLRLEAVNADAPPAPAAPGGYWVYRVVAR